MIKKIIYKYRIYCAIGFAIILGGVLFTTNHHNKKIPVVDALEIKEDEKAPINELETYNIDIKGAVKEPGVYKIVKGSIIDDAINLAGGLKKEAYTKNINLSKKVTDEMVIYIYTKFEYNKLNTKISNAVITSECNTSNKTIEIEDCIKKGSSIITPSPKVSSDSSNQTNTEEEETNLVNINTASKEQLMTLTGIGESKALSIIEYREQNNGFKTIEEIMNISGIGESSFAKIKDFITI